MFSSHRILGPTRSGKARYGISINYGHEVLQVECAVSQVQSYPYKDIRETLGWISTDAFLAPHVNARKF